MNKKWLFSIAYFFCTLLTVLLFHSYLSSEHNEVIAYSDFKRLVHEHKVLDVVINDRTVTVNVDMTGIELTTSTEQGATRLYRGPGHRQFAAFRVDDPNLISELQTEGVQYSGARRSHRFDELLSVLVPAVVFFGIWLYVVRSMGSPNA